MNRECVGERLPAEASWLSYRCQSVKSDAFASTSSFSAAEIFVGENLAAWQTWLSKVRSSRKRQHVARICKEIVFFDIDGLEVINI